MKGEKNMFFNPALFLEYLPYMGIGMLGVFMIVGVIILSTFVIGKATKPRAKIEE